MPDLTAHFRANFDAFVYEVAKAKTQLTDFDSSTDKVQASLNEMVNKFSGRTVVAEATLMAEAVERVGGAARLTQSELAGVSAKAQEAVAKLRAMGTDVPANLQNLATATKGVDSGLNTLTSSAMKLAGAFGIAFTAEAVVSGIVNFTKGLFNAADATEKLATETGMTIEEVTKLSVIAAQSSTTTEALASALEHMQSRLTDDKTRAALKDLGIDFVQIRTAAPYDQLHMVAEALGKIDDPAERARLGVKTLGNDWKEIAGAMGQDWDKLTKDVDTNVSEQVKAMNRLKTEMSGLWNSFQIEGERAVGNLVLAVEKAKQAPLDFVKNMAVAMATGADPYKALQAVGGAKGAADKRAAEAAKGTELPHMPQLESLESMGKTAGAVFQTMQTGATAALKASTDAAAAYKKQVEAANKVAEAQRELTLLGQDYNDTINKMDGDLVATIEHYLEAGASQSTLATAYKLTGEQVSAVAEKIKVQNKAFEEQQKSIDQTRELWREYGRATEEATATTSERMTLGIQRWFDYEVSKLKESEGNYTNHYNALVALANERLGLVNVNWDVMRKESKASLDDQAMRAEATWQAMAASADQYSPEIIQKYRDQAEALRQQASEWNTVGDAAVDAMSKAKGAADATTSAVTQQKGQVDALAGSFSVLNMSADQWRAKAAGMYADAARMATMGGTSTTGWEWQYQQNLKSGADAAMAAAGRQAALDRSIASMQTNAGAWGNRSTTITVNAMQGIDGDQVARELVSGMQRRGVPLG